jgi:hypothetical protein
MGGQVKVCPGGLKIDDGFITGNGGHGFSRFPESRWRTEAVGIERTGFNYGSSPAFARDFTRKCSRFMQATMQSSKVVQKECSNPAIEKAT